MFGAAGKGERRSLRGSARQSSKMPGRLPRLRALRPRPQQQQQRQRAKSDVIAAVAVDTIRRSEGNLKEALARHEEEAKKCSAKKTEDRTMDVATNEMDGDDDEDDNNVDDNELTMTVVADEEVTPDGEIDVDFAVKSEETIDLETERASYECKSCNPPKTLPSIQAYFEHLQKEHKYKGKNGHSPVENHCPACSYVALNVKDLESHQRLHHLKRKFFRCGKCDYVTHIRARYTKHVKYHSLPMIKCDACDFSSAYKWNLERHMRNHGGGGAFKCRACNFTADIRQSLTVHESYHHDPPVGQVNRKSNNAFERKPRNSPKRYNQVGASDFREALNKTGSITSINSVDSFMDDSIISIEDKQSALANAECIALKCEEVGCQFITAWDSEMQRHLTECHAPISVSKLSKPLPRLIPLKLANSSPNNKPSSSGPPTTLLRVPRVRVRPELAQIARDTELAKMYANKEATNSKRDAADIFERKNASFFDRIKEKLTTTATSINNGVPEVAVEQQSWDEDHMEERSIEETNTDESSTKLVIVGNKDHGEVTGAAVTILPSNEANQNGGLRPPPPLKAAVKNRGQSLLKNNPVTMHVHTPSGGGAVFISPATDENKRTQWKCKRCNYRDPNRENVLQHVKSHYESVEEPADEKNLFDCRDCPFSAPDAATLSLHRMHHRPNLEAIFKCYLCPYYVSTKAELLEHARLHGEELAAIHRQNMDFPPSPKKLQQVSISESGVNRLKEETSMEQVIQITSRNNVTLTPKVLEAPLPLPPPSLLLDTRAFPDIPLVWVIRPDGTLMKMLKCRHCPYVSSRYAEVRDHETMHVDMPAQGPLIACTDCSFTCTRREVMIAHTDMHAGSQGIVYCLVDETRPDLQQLSDVASLLNMRDTPALGAEPDLHDSRLVHCCGKCPARFLCEKELRIHLRYHSTELAYTCQWCSYAARQPQHLLTHQKAHSTEYQDRTKYLLSVYGHSQRYPPPATACVEAGNQETNEGTSNVAWIVVEINESSYNSATNQRTDNQVFTCAKCPARYFKLDALEYHMTLHGSNNRYKCNDCDYSSKTAQNLVKHQVVHRRQNDSGSEIAVTPVPAASASAAAILQPPPDPQFGVFMRGNPNFVYPGYLRNGRLKEKRYKCHKCPSAFEKREQYRIHLTLHGAKQRYRCDTCDYSVKYYANYVQHLKKHQANAEAQALRRRFEDDRISVDSDSIPDVTIFTSRSGKTLRSTTGAINTSSSNASAVNAALQTSNQDKQSLLLMQKKGIISPTGDTNTETIRCQNCPFSTIDKDAMDAHKRRHGIERMTPPCPHCNYIPRKDENLNEHIKLHFTRLYKPEAYLIVELLTLMMEKVPANGKELKDKVNQRTKEILFRESADGKFLPFTEPTHSTSLSKSTTKNTSKQKVIVDPNTGETKNHSA
ncbi:zinc finger protein 91-like isoform X5 [Linepithema humile]|uniref:zinc finger protein 91-like isoform X5 n=1 Tax=Linepithema humile TaxID=83485 RepID=UPI00351EB595